MNQPVSLQRIQCDFKTRMLGDDGHPGLAVYRNNYRSRLKICLSETLESTRRWLGEQKFEVLASAFIDARPPGSWSLDHYPTGFAAWLCGQGDEELELAADLAKIDWALAEVFVEQNDLAVTADRLSEIDWENARLALVSAARVLAVKSNALSVWTTLQADGEVLGLERENNPSSLLVWRQHGTCKLRALEPLESRYLGDAFFAFSALCETAAELEGEEAGLRRAGGLLARWAHEALVVSSV